jgi:hypothetical protein
MRHPISQPKNNNNAHRPGRSKAFPGNIRHASAEDCSKINTVAGRRQMQYPQMCNNKAGPPVVYKVPTIRRK